MKLWEARDTLTRVFDLHSIAADRYVRALQDAGALPSTTASVDAEHVGRLVLAMLAAPTPSDAVEALATFEQLELLVVERRECANDGRLIVTEVTIANESDVPVLEGTSEEWWTLAQAIPLVLEAGDTTEVTVRRSRPMAIITLADIRLLYGQRSRGADTSAAPCEGGQVVQWVTLTASGLEQIGALLVRRPLVSSPESRPAPVAH